jgi:hypothetical protein
MKRAEQEYDKWCALERAWEESRFGDMQKKAYLAGFRRAVQLAEEIVKRRMLNEHNDE